MPTTPPHPQNTMWMNPFHRRLHHNVNVNSSSSPNNNIMPKENDGRRSRRRNLGRMLLALVGGVVLMVCLGLIRSKPATTRPARLRQSSERNIALHERLKSLPEHRRQEPIASRAAKVAIDDVDLGIIRGEYTLINLQPGIKSLAVSSEEGGSSSSQYKGVMASFCKINWSLQATNPAKIPMFRDLQAASYQCEQVIRDLGLMVKKMRQYDADHPNEVISAPPSAVVFHETRCGSTLVANLFAASKPDNQHFVYSESPPPLAALQACDNARHCDPAKHVQLVQDVFFVMGRRPRPNRYNQEDNPLRAFYKIQSIGSHSISAFTQAFPTTPWFFIFRDSVEVMMSHVDPDPPHAVQRWAVCMRTRNWEPKRALSELLKQKQTSANSLTNEQYCAAHLASLCLSALNEYETQSSPVGHFINYQQLPDIMWESVLPKILHIDLQLEDVERMKNVAGVYSKGRGDIQSWEQDSQKKRKEAPTAVQEAATAFMGDVYQRLEQLKE